ncbi:MAG: methylated-DNA--[protein]-cysteine S-methyltransferase [Polyangiaceae bacterium]|jgi:methylated-DNA-[protein]-cysteine S-methyltransferase|nr:methylated-DNA--[protein]-cysteine S-methyltransferase [Polyangiaceae bacterium]
MTPFLLGRVSSPLGGILLVSDGEKRLVALDFETHEARMHQLLRRHHGGELPGLVERPAPAVMASALDAFFAGEVTAIDGLAVHTGGTAFEQTVWAALRGIPAGTTTTYGRLAASLGRPSASRAVGRANGANPVGIVIPCHRVIGADGSLTGYGGGIERKRWLLAHEGGARGAVPSRASQRAK